MVIAATLIAFIVSKINEAAGEDIAGTDADGNITTAAQGQSFKIKKDRFFRFRSFFCPKNFSFQFLN